MPKRTIAIRLGILAAIVVALFVGLRFSGLTRDLTVAGVRQSVQGAGLWGMLAFAGVFSVAQLAQVPGTVFYVASVFAWGRVPGFGVSYLASLLSVTLSFAFVRLIGGQPLGELRSPRVRRLLDRLDARPLRVMTALRVIFWTAPPLNYALALSRVRYPVYLAATALGLVLPLVAISALAGLFFQ